MIVPESITWPLPTMIFALLIATFCGHADAGRKLVDEREPPSTDGVR